jgi:hypothetical protein
MYTKIAAGISLVALGSVAGYAVGSGPAAGTPTAAVKPQRAEVRTQTIRRTVRIVKHEKPRHAPPSPPAEPVSRPAAAATPSAPPAISAAPPPSSSSPVRTRTSGGGSGHAEEHEAGEEHEGGDD